MKANEIQVGGEHYKKLAIQPWDFMESCMTHEEFMGFLRGNVIKYLARSKNGWEDVLKAQHYLQKLIEVGEKKKGEEKFVEEKEALILAAPYLAGRIAEYNKDLHFQREKEKEQKTKMLEAEALYLRNLKLFFQEG